MLWLSMLILVPFDLATIDSTATDMTGLRWGVMSGGIKRVAGRGGGGSKRVPGGVNGGGHSHSSSLYVRVG